MLIVYPINQQISGALALLNIAPVFFLDGQVGGFHHTCIYSCLIIAIYHIYTFPVCLGCPDRHTSARSLGIT